MSNLDRLAKDKDAYCDKVFDSFILHWIISCFISARLFRKHLSSLNDDLLGGSLNHERLNYNRSGLSNTMRSLQACNYQPMTHG